MSRDLNQCNFIGRLGRDPETKFTSGGSAITNFSIACGDDYTSKDGQKVEQTNWINCVSFGKQAEVMAEYLKKGSQVFIQGKQVTRDWEKDGIKQYRTEIQVNNFQFLGGKSEGKPAQQNTDAHPNATGGAAAADDGFDDIPFIDPYKFIRLMV